MADKLFDDIEAFLRTNGDDHEGTGVFEPEEYEAIIMAFATSRGQEGFTEDEMMKVIRWCEHQVIGFNIVQLLLKGLVLINLKDDDPEPVFSLSEEGKAGKDWIM